MTEPNPLARAVEIVGSKAELAARLNLTRAAVWQWSMQGRKVPAEYCPSIERMTNGLVTCEQLRPDVEWSYIRGTKKRKQAA